MPSDSLYRSVSELDMALYKASNNSQVVHSDVLPTSWNQSWWQVVGHLSMLTCELELHANVKGFQSHSFQWELVWMLRRLSSNIKERLWSIRSARISSGIQLLIPSRSVSIFCFSSRRKDPFRQSEWLRYWIIQGHCNDDQGTMQHPGESCLGLLRWGMRPSISCSNEESISSIWKP